MSTTRQLRLVMARADVAGSSEVLGLGPIGLVAELEAFAADHGLSVSHIGEIPDRVRTGPADVGAGWAVGLVGEAAAALDAVHQEAVGGAEGRGVGIFDVGGGTSLAAAWYRGGAARPVGGRLESARVEVSVAGLELVVGTSRHHLAGWRVGPEGVEWRGPGGAGGPLPVDAGHSLTALAPGADLVEVRPVALGVVFGDLLVGLRDGLAGAVGRATVLELVPA